MKYTQTMVLTVAFFLGFALLFNTIPSVADTESVRTAKVLYINAYHRGYSWSDDIENSLMQELQAFPGEVELSIEHLDNRRFSLKGRTELLVTQLEVKYADYAFDLIITSDNAAFDFAVAHRERLFPEVPMVFCGFNNLRPAVLDGMTNITGVNEEVDYSGTIDLALSVHPDVRTLAFIVSTADASNMRIYEITRQSVLPRYQERYEVVLLKDLPITEIQHRLNQLPENSLLMIMGETSDRGEGRALSPVESARMISSISPFPTYGFWSFHIGTGVLGGSMVTGSEQGRAAAKMALRILNGTPTNDIPLMLKSPTRFMFDHRVMERFGIKSSSLPEESIIVNIPFSFYEEYKTRVWTTTLVVLVLVIIIIMLNLNIAKRKQVEKAVKVSERRLSESQRIAHIGNWELNLITNELFWSEEIYRLFGLKPQQFDASYEAFLDNIHPDDRDLVSKAYTDSLKNKTPYQIVHRLLLKDKTVKYVNEMCKTYYDESGEPIRSVGTVQDITEQKNLEEQFRQSQKMEAIGKLSGGVAHDFNNLLTSITGNAELLSMKLEKDSPLKEFVVEITKASDRAASLTRQLLAFSRKQVLEPKVMSLNAVVLDMEKMLRRLIGEDIDLKTTLSDELGNVKADPGQVEQVILNLCVNARDAMPQGGKITIETANVDLDKSYARTHRTVIPGPYVMMVISDDGAGMDKETQSRIFDPFFTTKEQGKGTGLGLSTVYGIVKQSEGNIWVYSEPDQGTTFEVYLPRVEKPVEKSAKTKEPVKSLTGTETILLVEDDEMVRKVAHEGIKGYGYKVLVANCGKEALKICEENKGPIHLMLTDVVMPEMSGPKLAEHLQDLRPEIKVLYMSGYTDAAIVHHGVLDKGMNFIQKPFTPETLAVKVRGVLDEK